VVSYSRVRRLRLIVRHALIRKLTLNRWNRTI